MPPIKASNADQRRLLELQDADTRIVRLEAKARSLPQRARIAELDAVIAPLDHDVIEALGERDGAQAEVARIESDVKVVEARIARNRDRLLSGVDGKTATAMEHEIETLERRQSDLEDMELAAMERAEQAEASLAAAQQLAETSRAERAQLEASLAEELGRLRGELEEAKRDRAAKAEPIPADLLALYEKQRTRYGIGATLLQRRTSIASGVELTAQELFDVRQAADDDVLLDPNSSAILVRTEESGL